MNLQNNIYNFEISSLENELIEKPSADISPIKNKKSNWFYTVRNYEPFNNNKIA